MNPRISRAWLGPIAILSLGTASCVLFTALVPPILDPGLASRLPLIGGLPGDLPVYWLRFALSFLLLGLLPLGLALLLGLGSRDLGLDLSTPILRKPLFWALIPVAIIIGAVGGASPGLGSYYPYSRDLVGLVASQGLLPFLGHFGAYFFLYYLPWEFFFRGFLLLGLLAWVDRAAPRASPLPEALLLALVLFQTMPSTMLHVGHPLMEQLSAIPAGLAFGLLAWRTRSIFPGLLLHASMGLGTDLFIVLKASGYLG